MSDSSESVQGKSAASDRLAKNIRIAEARIKTIARHKEMVCKTYELKVDKSHLSAETLETLRRLFLEAKWFYNHLVASGDVLQANYKIKVIQVKNENGEFEPRELGCLSAQMRQGIIMRIKNSVRSLARLKRSGRRVGRLRFKSRVRSIPLKQYGKTYRINGDKVSVENVWQPLRVRGLGQVPKGAEFTSATIEEKNGDYFIHMTTYQEPIEGATQEKVVGIDAGIKHQLTLSNSLQIDEGVPETKKIRRLHRQLSRRMLRGRNWVKTNLRLAREYDKLTSRRTDIRNKIISKLISTYDTIAVQADNIAGWQRMWGRRVTTSAIGGIMSDLKSKARTPVIVDRFEPTSQKCSSCESLNSVSLDERIYHCERCGLVIDRDLNAAINDWKAVPAERREFTPVDTKAATELVEYFNSIPGVSASLVEEAGSRLLATEAAAFGRS